MNNQVYGDKLNYKLICDVIQPNLQNMIYQHGNTCANIIYQNETRVKDRKNVHQKMHADACESDCMQHACRQR